MRPPRVKRFALISIWALIMLTASWNWVGSGYVALLARAIPPVLPEGTMVDSNGHTLRFFTNVAVPAKQRAPTPEVGSPVPQPAYHRRQYEFTMNGLATTYGLIPAVGVLVAVPAISGKNRLLLIAGVLLLSFVAHIAGLYWLAEEFIAVLRGTGQVTALQQRADSLTFLMVFVPSVLWVPAMYVGWRRTLENRPLAKC